jgi:hypothetical protein
MKILAGPKLKLAGMSGGFSASSENKLKSRRQPGMGHLMNTVFHGRIW